MYSERAQKVLLGATATVYLLSFLLPANVVYFGENLAWSTASTGWDSALHFYWAIPSIPFLLVAAPANLLILAAGVLLLRRRPFYTPYLTGYALLGQLIWLTEHATIRFKAGYWLWLVSGAAFFALSVAARLRPAAIGPTEAAEPDPRLVRWAKRTAAALAAIAITLALLRQVDASLSEKPDPRVTCQAPQASRGSGLAFVGEFQSVVLRDAGGRLHDRSKYGFQGDLTRTAFGVQVKISPEAITETLALISGTGDMAAAQSSALGRFDGKRVALISLPPGDYQVIAFASGSGSSSRRIPVDGQPLIHARPGEVVLAGRLAEDPGRGGRLFRDFQDKALIRDVLRYELQERDAYEKQDRALAEAWLHPIENALALELLK